jgi:hypothetical protein
MEARITKLARVSASFSKFLARRRFRPNQEKGALDHPAARRPPHCLIPEVVSTRSRPRTPSGTCPPSSRVWPARSLLWRSSDRQPQIRHAPPPGPGFPRRGRHGQSPRAAPSLRAIPGRRTLSCACASARRYVRKGGAFTGVRFIYGGKRARQRYSHQSAPCHRATPVSVDRAASPTPHARGKSPASRGGREKSRETWPLRWWERIRTFGSAMRSHRRQRGCGLTPPDPDDEWRLLGPPPVTVKS